MDDIDSKALLLLAAMLLSAVGIELWRLRATARRPRELGPPPGRWPAPLVPFLWLGANLLLFWLAFPPFTVSSELYGGELSRGEMGILFRLPLALFLTFLALRSERRAGGTALTLSLAGCLTLALPLVLCPVVIIAFVLVALLLNQIGSAGPDDLSGQLITLGDAALLLAAVVVCGVLLFKVTQRFGRQPGLRPDQEE